jgi:hypothetical protein
MMKAALSTAGMLAASPCEANDLCERVSGEVRRRLIGCPKPTIVMRRSALIPR